ncbi:unnamed protein product, partial [marine sediment metagenome]
EIERFRGEQTPQELSELGRKIARWVQDNAGVLRSANPDIPEQLHDRAADNWRPLLAIADQAGGDWPTIAREAAVALTGSDADTKTRAVMVLEDLQALFEKREVDRLWSEEIVKHLVLLEDRPWPEYRQGKPLSKVQLANLLKKFRIKPRDVRIGNETKRGYLLEDCQDAFMRYIPPVKMLRVLHDSEQGTYDDPKVLQEKKCVAPWDDCKSNDFNAVAAVASCDGGYGEQVAEEEDKHPTEDSDDALCI